MIKELKLKNNQLFLFALLFLISLSSCKTKSPEEILYIKRIEKQRLETNEWMKNNINSPFNFKNKVEFKSLKYFDVDPKFVFMSKLYLYEQPETISILGTKGEERYAVRFGYLNFTKDNQKYKLNVYANLGQDSTVYYSIWFTDRTTNDETYGVGRYLSFEYVDDVDHYYTIDFNLAFNPYCAYNSSYSCAIPSKEDYLDLAIEAGEKKFHD